MSKKHLIQKEAWKINGFGFLALVLMLLVGGIYMLVEDPSKLTSITVISSPAVLVLLGLLTSKGFIINKPNQAVVLTFFGRYAGSISDSGFFLINPFCNRDFISLKTHNFESDKLKVNDAEGNPILIGAIVVWKVSDTLKAVFGVENLNKFVAIQSETAIRSLANKYPYDTNTENVKSLRCLPEKIAEELRIELQKKLDMAGVTILEASISHLAYAPEIAHMMLRRQQAQSILSARQKIVEGAISMVEMTINNLPIELNNDQKAAIVNNLLVSLVSEGNTNSVINTDSLKLG